MYKIIFFYGLKICRKIEKFIIFINSCLSWIMDIKCMRKIKERYMKENLLILKRVWNLKEEMMMDWLYI